MSKKAAAESRAARAQALLEQQRRQERQRRLMVVGSVVAALLLNHLRRASGPECTRICELVIGSRMWIWHEYGRKSRRGKLGKRCAASPRDGK